MNSAFFEEYRLGYSATGSHLKDYIYQRSREAFARGAAARDALTSCEAVVKRQEEVRRFIIKTLGGLPSMETPLEARITGSIEHPAFRVEKVIYQSRPRHYVTASLYLPRERPERCPAVLLLCGHSPVGRMARNYQVVCQMLAMSGLIVLAQDPIGQGERLSTFDVTSGTSWVPPATRDHDYTGVPCQLVGQNLARYFLHDAMRGVDYLLSRPEVDGQRIGVTGSSGGGTQTSLMALADPRIAAAAPGMFIMNRESYQLTGQAQDAEQIWEDFTAAGYDHEDILLAMAPKPFCVLAATADFFPIEGTRRTVERSRRIWELFGPEGQGKLELVEEVSTHAYTPNHARAAARFFTRHFLGREVDPSAFEPEPFTEAELMSTRSGQVKAEFPDAEFAFEATLSRANELEAKRRALPAGERRERAVNWLREKVCAHRPSTPANPRLFLRDQPLEGLGGDIAFWWVAPNVANMGMLFRPGKAAAREGKRFGVTIALWDGGNSALPHHLDWLVRECHGEGRAVLLLNLSTMGTLQPDAINRLPMQGFYGTLHKLADDLIWLGDSMAAFHTYEVLRVLEVLPIWPELDLADIRLYGHGRYGLFAKLAATLEPRLGSCEWSGSFTYSEIVKNRFYNYYDIRSVILPGVLEYFDMDELS